MAKTTMEIRIWEGSEIVGKTVSQVSQEYGVEVLKVARGKDATNPGEDLEIQSADYIKYVGESVSCLKLLRKSAGDSGHQD